MINRNLLLLTVISVFILFSIACKHETENNKIVDDECDPDKVYFVNDVQPILNSNCAYSGCHDASTHSDGVDLSTYDKIISTGEIEAGEPDKSELYEVIAEGEMPPDPNNPLSNDQKQIIYDWIAQGAKYNECVEDNCDTLDVKYSTHIEPVISTYCQGCHSGSNPDGNISLTSYSEVETIAANGKLLGVVEHQAAYSPMPKNGNKLSDCDIAKIKIWINEGSQNN